MDDQNVVPKQAKPCSSCRSSSSPSARSTSWAASRQFLARAPEISVRRALGASRADIFLQHIVECEVIGGDRRRARLLLSLAGLAASTPGSSPRDAVGLLPARPADGASRPSLSLAPASPRGSIRRADVPHRTRNPPESHSERRTAMEFGPILRAIRRKQGPLRPDRRGSRPNARGRGELRPLIREARREMAIPSGSTTRT